MARPPGRRPLNASLVPTGLDATLVLLRHGESTWVADGRFQGSADPPLSELGHRQAALAAARLADPAGGAVALPIPAPPPSAIVHSPLARAASTAAAVAAALGDPGLLRADAAFAEIGQGEWEGRTGAEITARWEDVLAGWRRDPVATWAPGGESLAEVDARVRAGLVPLLAALAHGREPGTLNRSQVLGYADHGLDEPWAILVGHDGTFKVTVLALLDLPLARFWSFPFALCGLTIVEFRGGRARLRAHNLVEHLGSLAASAAAASRPAGAL